MPLISEYYNIDRPVPFADVDVHDDNRLFLDPHMVRLRPEPAPFGRNAVLCLDSFLNEIVLCVRDGSSQAAARGERILQQFREPPETRLGMCASGSRGHGGAAIIGKSIWDALSGDLKAFVRVGVLRHLEELPLFVNGVDRDITSDLTTRIIFEPLARFTESMLLRFPELTMGTGQVAAVTRIVWDPRTLAWREATMTLPEVEGHPLLLIPKSWIRTSLLMSASRFYSVSVLDYAQTEQTILHSDGRVSRPSKKSLQRQPGLEMTRRTNRRVTLRALEHSAEDLVRAFTNFVDERLDTESSAA